MATPNPLFSVVLLGFKRASPGCLPASCDAGCWWWWWDVGGKGALPELVKPLFYMKVFTGLHQLIDTIPSGTLLSDRLKRIKWSAALLKPRWEGLAKGRVFLARKPVLWRFAADKIDCTGRIYSPSRSQVRQLESLIVSEAMVGAFPRFFGRKDPLAKRPHFFRQIISSWFFEVFKGELRHFEVWDGTVLPPNKLQCLFQTPHRQHMLSDS